MGEVTCLANLWPLEPSSGSCGEFAHDVSRTSAAVEDCTLTCCASGPRLVPWWRTTLLECSTCCSSEVDGQTAHGSHSTSERYLQATSNGCGYVNVGTQRFKEFSPRFVKTGVVLHDLLLNNVFGQKSQSNDFCFVRRLIPQIWLSGCQIAVQRL